MNWKTGSEELMRTGIKDGQKYFQIAEMDGPGCLFSAS